MDRITLICPICAKKLLTSEYHFDLDIKCPKCGTMITTYAKTGILDISYKSNKSDVEQNERTGRV